MEHLGLVGHCERMDVVDLFVNLNDYNIKMVVAEKLIIIDIETGELSGV